MTTPVCVVAGHRRHRRRRLTMPRRATPNRPSVMGQGSIAPPSNSLQEDGIATSDATRISVLERSFAVGVKAEGTKANRKINKP
jgi:hypothetical protein